MLGQGMDRALRAATVAVVLAGAMVAGPAPASAGFGDARVLAEFPGDPGFPEGVAVHKGRVYAAGAATFGTTGAGPSTLMAYRRDDGRRVSRTDAVGENLLAEHANSSIALDVKGRVHVLNTQLGIYRLDPKTGRQERYASAFPDLLPCAPVIAPPPCSPTPANQPPIPNDIAFAPDGSAYVSDSMQATIWRIPPGGGEPRIWFQDERFASPCIGVNGLRISPAGDRVFVTVTVDLRGNPSIYSLPLAAKPAASDLRLFHRFPAGELPDGIAFGETGDLYVAMATPGSFGVLILRPDGSERARLGNPRGSLTDPYDGPANIAFDGEGHILLTNHAPVTGLTLRKFSIVDVEVGDAGSPLFRPGS
jgi:sugar lactone lactonase YvrE